MIPLSGALRLAGAASLLVMLGCGPEQGPAGPVLEAAAGAKGAGVTVSSAEPSYGHQGDVQKQVRIRGSGFEPGDQAAWQRGGVTDPKISVNSTQFVSSTELVATISIAGDATLAFYDIAITRPGRKGGIGTMLFEVTQAIALQGTSRIRWANESGQLVGQGPGGAFIWSLATGMQSLSADGIGMAISEDGLTVVGTLGSDDPQSKRPVVWTRSGSSWLRSNLPMDPAAFPPGQAHAIASDPVTGSAIAAAGWESLEKKSVRFAARLWLRAGSTWQRIVLPEAGPGSSLARDVNGSLTVVGDGGGGSAVWVPNGVGGWNLQIIGPGDLYAINESGSIAVGRIPGPGNDAIYYQRVGGTWTGPFLLPGLCSIAVDVDELGRILMEGCPITGPRSRVTSAVVLPPYGVADIVYLGGFGTPSGADADRMSRLGTWIVGSGAIKNATVGAYWRIF